MAPLPQPVAELALPVDHAFNACPVSWFSAGSLRDLARGPKRIELPGKQPVVAFLTASGRPVVLSARCSHLGVDLAKGCVRGERLACPLHGWEYNENGSCEHIPIGAPIPSWARQTSFPTEECGGDVFFFNRAEAKFPLPFFDGLDHQDLYAAHAFEFTVDAPWQLAAANGFDVQHFRCAHDRTLCGEPIVERPHPFAWRVRATFRVTGNSIFDRLTRLVSGAEVEMSVTSWCGNLVYVTATFQRTTTYGIVSFIPLDSRRTRLRDIVLVPRSRASLGRALFDPIDAAIRRRFIREFVRSDVDRSAGMTFSPRRTIAADQMLVDYLDWLHPLHS